jgi:hypothetical protein
MYLRIKSTNGEQEGQSLFSLPPTAQAVPPAPPLLIIPLAQEVIFHPASLFAYSKTTWVKVLLSEGDSGQRSFN